SGSRASVSLLCASQSWSSFRPWAAPPATAGATRGCDGNPGLVSRRAEQDDEVFTDSIEQFVQPPLVRQHPLIGGSSDDIDDTPAKLQGVARACRGQMDERERFLAMGYGGLDLAPGFAFRIRGAHNWARSVSIRRARDGAPRGEASNRPREDTGCRMLRSGEPSSTEVPMRMFGPVIVPPRISTSRAFSATILVLVGRATAMALEAPTPQP